MSGTHTKTRTHATSLHQHPVAMYVSSQAQSTKLLSGARLSAQIRTMRPCSFARMFQLVLHHS